jgi:hypothetical protein
MGLEPTTFRMATRLDTPGLVQKPHGSAKSLREDEAGSGWISVVGEKLGRKFVSEQTTTRSRRLRLAVATDHS